MAGISFKRGSNLANLPIVDGQFIIHTSEHAIYTDVGTERIRLGDFIQVANVASLPTDAHESALYYCIAENVLAKYSAEKGWVQINKQPTAEEMKTLLGLGSMAYLSEVAEANLNEALAAKINGANDAKHTHENATVLDGITAEKVAAWDAAEKNAKDYADDLNEAMAERVDALEAEFGEEGAVTANTAAIAAEVDRATKAEKAIVDTIGEVAEGKTVVEMINEAKSDATYDDTKVKEDIQANADAIAAETERAEGVEADFEERIAAIEGDYLTSTDKEELQKGIDDINDALDILTDGIDAEKVDGVKDLIAYVEEHGTEVTGMKEDIKENADAIAVLNGDATTDGSVAKTVKDAVDALKIGDYATTEYVNAELDKKVDKVEGKSLIADTEIERLAGMSTGANKVEASETNGSIKIDGVETVVYTHPEKHAISEVTGLQDALDALAASEDVYTKEEVDTAIDNAMSWGSF